jgi:hypothetical protein
MKPSENENSYRASQTMSEPASKLAPVVQLVQSMRSKLSPENKVTVYRFDIFKGKVDDEGTVTKIKSVGSAYVREGLKTYTLSLKTFLNEKFYLLANSKPGQGRSNADYVILTREPGQNVGRKYFWNNVGEGTFLTDVNHGLMKLSWDILSCDIFMNLNPINVTELAEAVKADEAA